MAQDKKTPLKFPLVLIIFSLILIFSLGSAIYFYTKYRQAVSPKSNLSEIEAIVKKVSELMVLPQGEIPTLATVSDKSKLQNQEFFQRAENGDKILVYAQAKKAILYRPSTNKIIDIAPIRSVQQTTPAASPSLPAGASAKAGAAATPSATLVKVTPTPISQKARIVLLNGTDTVGITYKVEKELLSVVKDIEIVDKDNAAKSDYKKTIIIDLSGGKFKEKAQELATFLKGEIGALPEGETKPDADILVILAQ